MEADGFMDVLRSGYNTVKNLHDKVKSGKYISRATDFALKNPVTNALLSLNPAVKSGVETVNTAAKKYGYGKNKRK